MKFRLVAHWPTEDIFPVVEEFNSAKLAIRRYRQLVRFGMSTVGIFLVKKNEHSRISPTMLKKLSLAERPTVQPRARRMQNTIISAVLGMIASALPSAFGDFGVVSHLGTLRAARTSRANPRRRGSNSLTDAAVQMYVAASSYATGLSPVHTILHEECGVSVRGNTGVAGQS